MRARIVTSAPDPHDARTAPWDERRPALRLRLGLQVAGAALAAMALVGAFLTIGLPGGGGVDSASAAVNKAAAATAELASFSGTATMLITHDGQEWAGLTVRWNGGDVSLAEGHRDRELLVVDDMLYGHDDEGGWIELGSPDSIDPESGTTPAEVLAATRADIGGETLSRITTAMTDLTTRRLDDGSTVYSGTVAAGLIATEAGFKEGEHIRVFPFGYVAHDAAADPEAPIEVAITVGADGLIGEVRADWGGGGSVWTYTVAYTDLGSTAEIVAPENAQPFPRRTPVAPPTD